jgi:prepilin-type N-terminal cleavage/methylation domain-containing protein
VRRRQRGFTLIEVLVALTVLALSILLITRAFLTILTVTNQGGNLTVASSLAMRVLEEIRAEVEGQSTSSTWTAEFDSIPASAGPTPFPAPYVRYSYTMAVNQVDLSPTSVGPESYPCWLTSNPPGCTPETDHSNTIKWVTVRVSYDGQLLAEVSSAVIRDMYRRP